MTFQKNLYLLRNKAEVSQDELAYALGVSRQTITSWENGQSYPNIIILKKMSEFFRVSADELLNGFNVHRLPQILDEIKLTKIGDHEGPVEYQELPNWFVTLQVDASVSWAIYDHGKRDYAYHLTVSNKANLHGKECLEINVEEYDPDLNLEQNFVFFASLEADGVYWLGRIHDENGIKHIETYKDAGFLESWGVGGELKANTIHFENAEDYLLEYGRNNMKVVKVTYFESSAPDEREDFFELYLNQDYESVMWKRYSKKINNPDDNIMIDGIIYGLEGTCVTNRF